MMNALKQISYLWADIGRITNGRFWRWYTVFFTPGFAIILNYRLNRLLFLLLGDVWRAIHTILSPIGFLLRPWLGSSEIHYMADIGPGMVVLHPGLGVVISRYTKAGHHLTLSGGNCIGMKHVGETVIGNNVVLGTSANILGPVIIGNNVVIGMSALVLYDASEGQTVVGVPARPINATNAAYNVDTE